MEKNCYPSLGQKTVGGDQKGDGSTRKGNSKHSLGKKKGKQRSIIARSLKKAGGLNVTQKNIKFESKRGKRRKNDIMQLSD